MLETLPNGDFKLNISIGNQSGEQSFAVEINQQTTCGSLLKKLNSKFNYRQAVDNIAQKLKEKDYGLFLIQKDTKNPLSKRQLHSNDLILKIIKSINKFSKIELYQFVYMEVENPDSIQDQLVEESQRLLGKSIYEEKSYERKGWLMLKKMNSPDFKERYFILYKYHLYYYKSDKESSKHETDFNEWICAIHNQIELSNQNKMIQNINKKIIQIEKSMSKHDLQNLNQCSKLEGILNLTEAREVLYDFIQDNVIRQLLEYTIKFKQLDSKEDLKPHAMNKAKDILDLIDRLYQVAEAEEEIKGSTGGTKSKDSESQKKVQFTQNTKRLSTGVVTDMSNYVHSDSFNRLRLICTLGELNEMRQYYEVMKNQEKFLEKPIFDKIYDRLIECIKLNYFNDFKNDYESKMRLAKIPMQRQRDRLSIQSQNFVNYHLEKARNFILIPRKQDTRANEQLMNQSQRLDSRSLNMFESKTRVRKLSDSGLNENKRRRSQFEEKKRKMSGGDSGVDNIVLNF